MVVPITGQVPTLTDMKSEAERTAAERMYEYMGLKPNKS
jgi:hypothetical protein